METLYRRKVYNELKEWKEESQGRFAVIVEGARRVGKSTVVKSFAENEYHSHIFIDFSNPNKNTLNLIEEGIGNDFDSFFMKLQVSEGVTLYPRESVIVFDEVQSFPKARQTIKHLVADGRFDYIETGSLISLRKKISEIVIPSEEYRIEMHPMDFEEYLWVFGDETTVPYIQDRFLNRRPLGRGMHETVMKKYREYMIIGGMPQVVSMFLETKDLKKTDRVKRRILDLYHSDIGKIPTRTGANVRHIFDMIPALLSRHNKTFSPGEVRKNSRTRDYLNSIAWLKESKMVNICYECTDPNVAMMLNINDNSFKCYMADTGLLISLSFMTGKATPEEVYNSLIFDKLSINKGMFFENMVAQELVRNGHNLIFSSFNSDDKNYEVDFIISSGVNISPIEVKSGVSGKHTSLDKFKMKYRSRIGECYVIHTKDLRVDGNVTYLPIYMTMFL